MKEEFDFERLMMVACGHTAFQLLWAGLEFDLFTRLSREPNVTGQQIAEKLDLMPQPTRILLVGLTALGILRKDGETYSNARLTEKMLNRDDPENIVAVLGWQAHIVYKGLTDFVESLRQGSNVGLRHFPGGGDTLYERLESDPRLERVFHDAMSCLSRQANKALIEAAQLGRFSHLVDVGGGDATNALAFAAKYPKLNITVFDSASVCELAEKNIASAHMNDRVKTHPGDIFADLLPTGIDAVLYSHMFTIWSAEKNTFILRKTYDALPSGGSVLILNMIANDDDTGPLSTAMGSPYFLAIATGEGMLYSWSDYRSWLREAGFDRVVRIDNLPFNHGLLIGSKK